MIVKIATRNRVHSGRVQFSAMLRGLTADRLSDTMVEVVVRDTRTDQILGVIGEAGGRIVSTHGLMPMGRG